MSNLIVNRASSAKRSVNSFYKTWPRSSLPIISIVLAVLLFASAAVVCTSPFNKEYVLNSFIMVILGASIAYLFSRPQNVNRNWVQIALNLGILSQFIAATTQAVTAISLPSSFFVPVNDLPGVVETIYLLLCGASFVLILLNSWGPGGIFWGALFGAATFSSTIYLRSFTVVEAGPIYGSIFALMLTCAFILINYQPRRFPFRKLGLSGLISWLAIFLIAYGASALVSPTMGDSLSAWLRLVTLVVLVIILAEGLLWHQEDQSKLIVHWRSLPAGLMSRINSTQMTVLNIWKVVAWVLVVLAGIIPILLGAGKFIQMAWRFDLPSAITYRLHPNEMGGANIIARTVLCVIPLGLALISTSNTLTKYRKLASTLWIMSSIWLLFYCHSWEGVFASFVSLVVFFIFTRWNFLIKIWTETFRLRSTRLAIIFVSFFLLIVAGIFLFMVAEEVNIFSFNLRLVHWHGAILAWLDHFWLGGGPANEILYTPYADQVNLISQTQIIRDDLAFLFSVQSGYPLTMHSHNLLLEIGSGTGMIGFITFCFFLAMLFKLGVKIAGSLNNVWKIETAACLAGIIGELAWGSLDVLVITPPMFSFPIWCLLGLLFAALYLREGSTPPEIDQGRFQHPCPSLMINGGIIVLMIVTVLLPAIAFTSYAGGFLAFQEHRWKDALRWFEQTIKYSPLDAHSYDLLARSRLEDGDFTGAQAAYVRANKIKQGYSPYLAQLGWLSWLEGDINQAANFFEQAINQDPREAWDIGLHANLGLLDASRGNKEKAVALFKQSIELHPELAGAFYWRPVQHTSSEWKLNPGNDNSVLDPIYQHGQISDLELRIFKHLGLSEITERNFPTVSRSPKDIFMTDVLDAIEADYWQARDQRNGNSALFLAALSEASTVVGMAERAEWAYLKFQSDEPDSVYGYRGLGLLYNQTGRNMEAEQVLTRAKTVNPSDHETHYQLAQIYLDRREWENAAREFDEIFAHSSLTLFYTKLFSPELYTAQARLYEGIGKKELTEKALLHAGFLSKTSSVYLQIADYYQQEGKTDQAARQCIQAAEVFFSTWQSPQMSELEDIGHCLAKTNPSDIRIFLNSSLSRQYPFLSSLLAGHVYQNLGDLENAESSYRRANSYRPLEGAPSYFLGGLFRESGRLDEAEKAYRLASQLEPYESLSLLALGNMQWNTGNNTDALESLYKAIRVTPGWDYAHLALGNVLLRLGYRDAVDAHFQTVLDLQRASSVEPGFELLGHIGEAVIQSPGDNYVHLDLFTIQNRHQPVLFMHPDSSVTFNLWIPTNASLMFSSGISPEAWNQAGDGVTFLVYIKTQDGVEQAFSNYFDPKNSPEDQQWHSHVIDLSHYSGQTVTLIFETRAGPDGDYRFDWAGWGRPRIIIP